MSGFATSTAPERASRHDRRGGSRFRAGLTAVAVALATVVALPAGVFAVDRSIPSFSAAVAEDFDTLASTTETTHTTLPAGWALAESGTGANGAYRGGTGSANSGDTYSFGATGSSERAFGTLRSGSVIPIIGASFSNDTGGTMTSLDISYIGEQWRAGVANRGAADRLDFQYSSDATSLITGTWTDVDALDFSSPQTSVPAAGALDGNAAANRTAVSSTITGLSIAAGATLWIRWLDFDIASSDDGLAIDDFSLTANGVAGDAAPEVLSTSPADGATGVPVDSEIAITFSEPVDVTGDWVTVECEVTGTRTDVQDESSDGTTFGFAYESDFAFNEECTVSIDAASVTDQDTDDPPDAMEADHIFSFTVIGDVCVDDPVATYEIQGDGDASPLQGDVVTTRGVVTGDFETFAALAGFYIQDPSGDGDTATSDGLFIFNGSRNDVDRGDLVAVTGEVVEFNGITELTDVTVTVCSIDQPIPTTSISLPEAENGDLEQNEGMHVSFAQELTISQNFFLGRYGQLTLSSDGRMYNPTNVYRPGTPEAIALAAENARRVIILDDGRTSQNPNPIPYIGEDGTNRAGDTITGLTGNVDYGLITSNSTTRDYRLQPTEPVVIDRENERTDEPEDVGGRIQVAAFNVLNYFDTIDRTGASCYPSGTRRDCRGADSEAEFTRQRDKIIAAVVAMDADIVGLMEIENDETGATEDLISGLNAESGAGTYDFIETGIIGGDAIKVALIYQPASVTPVGDFEILTTADDPRFLDDQNRPPLAQTFSENLSGRKLTVVVNHLKSKGSDCNHLDDPDTGDGQGNCNKTREAAAEAIVDWLDSDPTDSDDPDFMVIGDLNSYAREDPIVAFEDGGYVDLIREFIGSESYTYIFDGWSGNLDHMLGTESVVPQVTDVTEWHINTDEPSVIDYNTEFKTQDLYQPDAFRSSDHDPVIVGLDLTGGAYPIAKDECKDGGWRTFTDPTFRNQGQCVTWVHRERRG
jgi:predicted extracellular nuclease